MANYENRHSQNFIRTLLTEEIVVVYHLPKKSGNFGRNVSGKTIFFFPSGNSHGKTKFLES